MNEVHLDGEEHVVFCTKSELFIIKCTYNIDFNDEFSSNGKVGSSIVYEFYNWGMVEVWTISEKNITTKSIYMRITNIN